MAAAANRGLALALAGIALLLASTLAAYRVPPPRGPDAPPAVFSAYRAQEILRDLVGHGVAHPIGSPANARIRAAIVERLAAVGYVSELQSGFACSADGVCGFPVNIVARLRGASTDCDVVLLAAHYDSVPAGPGASDDGAAVASMLEIARIVAARRQRHPIVLLITDGEEAGLLGASLFVRGHPLSKHVKAAVNLDARGTSGSSLMFETGSANSWLMHLYGSAIARPVTNSLYYVVYKLLQNDTDFTVFKAAGYQGFNFAFIGNVGRYHTPLDDTANADAGSIQQQGDNALAVLSALANSPSLHPPIAESVFFDAFARALITWSPEFALAAALAALLLTLAETLVLLRGGAVALRQISWGAAGVIGALVPGAALCCGLLGLGLALGAVPPLDGASWIAHPLPMQLSSGAIALLCAAVAGACLAQRAGFWGFWVAATLLSAVLALAGAALMPGASFMFLLTAAAAGLGALPAAVKLAATGSMPAWTTGLAALLPVLAIFAAVFPLLRILYTALGSPAWPVSTLVLGFGGAALLPLLASGTRRARQWVMGMAALTAVAGALITFCLAPYSAEWPQRLNLEYWLDADSGQAHYLARCDSLRLPAALAAAAHFDPVPRPRFAGSASLAFYADAPAQPLRGTLLAPELLLTAAPMPASQSGAAAPAAPSAAHSAIRPATHFELLLRSPRGAPEALVIFPASAHVEEAVFSTAEGPVRAKLSKLRGGGTVLDVVSLPAAGVQFSIDAAGQPPSVQVFDQSYAFPAQGQALERARPSNATPSQNGDLTVVHRTVSFDPAADRTASLDHAADRAASNTG